MAPGRGWDDPAPPTPGASVETRTSAVPPRPASGPAIVVMGVSGSGKSTVGVAVAARLGLPFLDADDLHPPANRAKMAAGQPLTDDDRAAWLEAVGRWLQVQSGGGVTACSALRRRYRDVLRRHRSDVDFLHLTGSHDLIARRQAHRPGHFMPATLLPSQFDTLEPLEDDERGVAVDVSGSVEATVDAYLTARGLAGPAT